MFDQRSMHVIELFFLITGLVIKIISILFISYQVDIGQQWFQFWVWFLISWINLLFTNYEVSANLLHTFIAHCTPQSRTFFFYIWLVDRTKAIHKLHILMRQTFFLSIFVATRICMHSTSWAHSKTRVQHHLAQQKLSNHSRFMHEM